MRVKSCGVRKEVTEAVLQILTILAYLAIGLLSVTFPIYAISVNYLPQEKWEGEKESKKRIDDLRKKIAEKTADLQQGPPDTKKATELKEQIEKYQYELTGTEQRFQYLTAKGAVGYPSIALAIALLFVGVAIHTYYQAVQLQVEGTEDITLLFGAISGLFILYAAYRLYKTISAVEVATLRPYRTVEFQIGFGDTYEASAKVKAGKAAHLSIYAKTDEVDIENFAIAVRCPKKMKVDLNYTEDFIMGTAFDYDSITLFRNFVPRGYSAGFGIGFTPKNIETYTIRVHIHGKGICDSIKELTIEVVA